MEEITLTLDRENYPQILKRYGTEGAKKQAISMCQAQGLEMTETNLYSCLSTLESDLASMFP
jgi:hypothetical protein